MHYAAAFIGALMVAGNEIIAIHLARSNGAAFTLFWSMAARFPVILLVAQGIGKLDTIGRLEASHMPWLGLGALFYVIGWGSFSFLVGDLKANAMIIRMIFMTEMVWVMVVQHWIFDENISLAQWGGGVLILLGSLIICIR